MFTTEETPSNSHGKILISVVIPTYNRPSEIEGCLASLSAQEFDHKEYEVVVVDDGGTLPLQPILDRFGSELQLTLIRQDNGGPSAARNTGIFASRGKYIALTDDDCRPDPDWLSSVKEELRMNNSAMLGGHTVNILDNNPYSDSSQVLVNMIYRFYNNEHESARFFTSNNIVAKRSLVLDIGGFRNDFRFAEDREFCDRWLVAGWTMHYCPKIIMYHRHDLTLRSFWYQHFGYGKGGYLYQKLRRERGTGSLKHDANFHLQFYRWLPIIFIDASILVVCRRMVLILLSQIANFSGFVAQFLSARKGADTY